MVKAEIDEVLRYHKLWLNGDEGGSRADLTSADLRDADLSFADLRGSDLRSANLTSADLRDADLRGSDLHRANLRGSDLRSANLTPADLRDADLRGSDLRGADIDYASFTMSCNFSRFTCDLKIIYQLLAHVASLDVDGDGAEEFAAIRSAILPYAIKSHCADDLEIKESAK